MDELGPEIAVDGVRPDWYRGEQVNWLPGCGLTARAHEWDDKGWASIGTIRLPADHPYYLAQSKGFKYWPGGDEAPGDWDGGAVLYACGEMQGEGCAEDWSASSWARSGASSCIIGYKPCSGPNASHIDPETSEDDGDYVRVKTMSEAEARALFPWEALLGLHSLGIIREETLLEQFERSHPDMTYMEMIGARKAIEWMESRNA